MHLCENLLAEGFEILGIDNINDYYSPKLKEARLSRLLSYSNFNFIKVDISDIDALKKAFNSFVPDIVVNLAAQAGVRYSLINPNAYLESNVIGFLNVLECCVKYKTKGLIYASSSSVYGGNDKIPFSVDDIVNKPISIYATSKLTNELMAYTYHQLYGLNTTGLRFFTVYGPWGRPDMAYYIFCDKISKKQPISIYNNGNMKRDFTYIDDIISGIKSSILNNYKYEIFNLGNNCPERLIDFIEKIEDCIGSKAIRKYKDMQPGDVKETYADIDYTKKMLNYNPNIGIDIGIPRFIEWYKNYI